jgi:glyoxylase-like metal-dependent hydrolase (beta-lactamase superfamily II)
MFGENTYLIWDDETKDTAIIDPGMINDSEQATVSDFIKENNLALTKIINTHMHLDHSFGVDYIKSKYQVPLYAGAKDEPLALHANQQGVRFGINLPKNSITINHKLYDGENVSIGNEKVTILETPGHSKGSIAIYYKLGGWVLVGDTLFQGSIGRTDLDGGSLNELIKSIQDKLFSLPADTIVLPGHGGTTTIDDEKLYNPYLCKH